ncbi:MAG: Fe-S cluster assembly protein SufD [Alphaproteobacteria bacterium]|nr:Fe-S cluster assembly protein SufD [Alphaproteobacteria bacterium]
MPLLSDKTYLYTELAQEKGVVLPTPKTEAWKYTRLRDLLNTEYQLCPSTDKTGSLPPFEADVIHIGNGWVVGELPRIEGVSLSFITETMEKTQHPFALMNAAYLTQGLKIEISGKLKRPLLLNYFVVPEDKNYFYHFRNQIICHENSSAEIIEQFTYEGAVKSCYFANIVNEIRIEANAKLHHYKYQNEAFKANHIALHKVAISQSGEYESFCLQKGANIARNETEIALNGEGAEAVVNAAYMMNGWATLDTTTNIYHYVPHTKSSQLIKGVIGGTAHGVFQGRIHIAPNAIQTTGTQLHKAILLSDEAEIDVKPELEIFADDVKCSHGAASGELDKEQLFYMRSRGIGEEEAKQILINAYLTDTITQISDERVREWFKILITG